MVERTREQRLRELFERALPLVPAERDRLLAEIDDELLVERLRALLAQDARGTVSVLQRDVSASLHDLRRIGNFELLRELGHGGMGTVMLARQVEPVERLVALKMVSGDADSAAATARFEQERQTLALMNHPGIAQIYEGGAAADGTLYFSMEYVRGEPITSYCDRRRLGLQARIRLFADVCSAVHYAHQRAVLHRDLKPGNILVSEDGQRVQPKVIDFGVARALMRAPGLKPSLDDPEIVVGTWFYMSPEQADPTGQDLDTRCDIYALGVLLYELLVGELPLVDPAAPGTRFLPTDFGRFRELLLAVRPPRASERLAALPAAARAERARQRGTQPATMARQLRGDLDAILATALAKDRNDRYPSASELRADLLRHLRLEPVSVMPATVRYRVDRFVRRNRALAAALAILVLGLVGAVAGTTYGLIEQRRARTIEASAHDRDRRQSQRMAALADFFDLMVVYGDPGIGERPPGLREVLDRLVRTIDQRYAGRRQEEAAVRAGVGNAYLVAGEPKKAEVQLLRAHELLDAGADPVAGFLLLDDLTRATMKVRGFDAARGYQAEMLRLGVQALTPIAPEMAQALQRLAATLQEPQHRDRFLTELDAAIEVVMSKPRADAGRRVAGQLLGLLALLRCEEEPVIGSKALQRLEAAVRQAIDDDLELALPLARYAEYMLGLGAFDDARRLASEVTETLDRAHFDQHWLRLQAARVRGLAQALGNEPAEGEIALVGLHDQLWDLPPVANEQAQRAAGCLRELAQRLQASGRFAAFCAESVARGRARAAVEPGAPPWWPALATGLPESERAAALAALPAKAAGEPAWLSMTRGALLLRLERYEAALAELEAARKGLDPPPPELLADLVRAYRAAGRSADASATQVLIEQSARSADGAPRNPRWGRALAAARS